MLILVVINSINRLIGHFGLIRRGSDFIFGVGIGLAIGRIGTFLVTIFQLGEKGIIDFTNVPDDIRVKAAVSYYSLNKDDNEINYRLLYLKDNSLDLELRKFLSTVI